VLRITITIVRQVCPIGKPGQRAGRRQRKIFPTLFAAAIGFHGDVPPQVAGWNVGLHERRGKLVRHRLNQLRMIVFQRQEIVAFTVDDLLCDILLAAHRIDRDWNGCDFIRFRVGRDLAERQPGFTGPGRNQVQRIFAGRFIERATQGLAVNGDVLADLAAHVIQPLLNAGHEFGRIEHREDAAERVVRRDAVLQSQERPQPVEPLFTEAFDIGPAISAGNRAAQGDDQQFEQFVPTGALDARIGKLFKR